MSDLNNKDLKMTVSQANEKSINAQIGRTDIKSIN